MEYCPSCGAKLPPNAEFCPKCGRSTYSQKKQGGVGHWLAEFFSWLILIIVVLVAIGGAFLLFSHNAPSSGAAISNPNFRLETHPELHLVGVSCTPQFDLSKGCFVNCKGTIYNSGTATGNAKVLVQIYQEGAEVDRIIMDLSNIGPGESKALDKDIDITCLGGDKISTKSTLM